MKTAPVKLDVSMRQACEAAIRERCRFMEWGLIALNVRTNHVHIVVSSNEPPEKVMTSFKARSTSAMRAKGLVGPNDKVWTRHGSTRRLATGFAVERATVYVTEAQGPDLP
jgi:REP element-mobilizing transposase RayT